MRWTRRTIIAASSAVVFGFFWGTSGTLLPAAAQESQVTVFAAASMKNALDAAAASWQEESGNTAMISYAGSSTLARQLEEGAPADIFISASLQWMDHLEESDLIDESTRTDLLGNRLVLVAPSDSDVAVEIAPDFQLTEALEGGRLAMANTDAVPAGIYGKTALTSLGVWDSVEEHVAQAQDVRAALALVSRGEAPLGIVYQTDAAADSNVKIVDSFPDDTHGPIVYPIALMAESDSDAARSLLDFLMSGSAAPFFEEEGFTVLQ